MGFFSRKKKSELILVIDIGSASVGAALVLLQKGSLPYILYDVRKDMVFQSELNFERFRNSMEKSVSEVCSDVQKEGLPMIARAREAHIDRAYCTLAAPWYATQTRKIKREQKEPVRITEKFIRRIVEHDIDAFTQSSAVKKQIGDDAVTIVENRIVQVKLNGYEMVNPYNKEARKVEVFTLIGVSPDNVLARIRREITNVFHIKDIEFGVFAIAAFDIVRDIEKAEHSGDFLFIDVSGELTDVSLVRDGVLLKNTSFPIGKKTILRKLSKRLNTTVEEVISLLRLQYNGVIDKGHEKKMEKGVVEVENEWISAFSQVLDTLSNNVTIPSTVYVISDHDLDGWIQTLVGKEQFAQYTISDETFTVISMNTSFLNGLCRFSQQSHRDPFLILETVFAHKLLHGV